MHALVAALVCVAGAGAMAIATVSLEAATAAAAGADSTTCFTQGNNDLDSAASYTVPASGAVTQLEITLNGEMGEGYTTLDSNGNFVQTPGGAGSALTAVVPVTPGSTVEVGTLPGGSGGSSNVLGETWASGNYLYQGAAPPAGDGGAAQFIETTGPCPQLLAIAGAGGGGGGIGAGGGGGNADLGTGAGSGGNGGNNSSVDGSGGGGATANGGGGSGSAGYDHWSSCSNGSDGQAGGLLSGGNGGEGASNTTDPAGHIYCAGGTGAGGGGAGYYYGGGGGSGFDDDPSGGGGGGSAWVAPGSTVVSDTATSFQYCGFGLVSYLCTCWVNPYYDCQQTWAPPFAGPVITPIYTTKTTIDSVSPNPAIEGQQATIAATVTGGLQVGGTVTFYDGTTNLGSGQLDANGDAAITTSSLPPGEQVLTASYAGTSTGSETDNPSTSSPFYVNVAGYAAPTLVTGPSIEQTLPGDTATFTAAAYGNPEPTVQWQISTDGARTWSAIAGATEATTVAVPTFESPTATVVDSTYSFTVASGQNGDEFRAVFSNDQGSSTTNAGLLEFSDSTGFSVSPPFEQLGLGTTEQLSATATYPSGETRSVTGIATWRSSDTNVATVSSTGLVTAVGSQNGEQAEIYGSITEPDGSVTSSFATVQVSLANPTTVTVSPSSPLLAAGAAEQFTATGHFANGYSADLTDEVNWSSSNPNVVTNDGQGAFQVSPNAGADSVTVTASAPSDSVSGTATISTQPGTPVSLSLTPTQTTTIGLGQTYQMTATATYADGSTASVTGHTTWTSLDSQVASVSSSGLVTGTSTQQDNLIAQVLGTYTAPNGTPVQASTFFIVSLDNPTAISISPSTLTLPRNGTEFYTATASYPGGFTANVTDLSDWSTGNGAVAGFGNDGELVAFSSGAGQSTSVSAALGSATGSGTVNVELGDPTTLTIGVPSGSLGLGQTEQLTATAGFANGHTSNVTDTVVWSSAQPSAASISSTGLVTGLQASPTQQIFYATLTSPDASQVATNSFSNPIVVNANSPLSVTVAPGAATILPDEGQNFVATGHYPGGLTVNLTNVVQWSSDTTGLQSYGGGTFVSDVSTGVDPAGGAGHAIATMSSNGVSGSASVTVPGIVTVSGPSQDSTSAGPGYVSGAFTASGGSGSYDWTLNGPYGSGLSLSSSTGSSVEIVGSPNTNDGNNLQLSLSVTDPNDTAATTPLTYFSLSINPQAQSINFGSVPATALGGSTLTLAATGGGSGNAIVYGVTGYCSLAGEKVTFFDVASSCVIVANQAGNQYYAAAPQAYVSVSILETQSVSFTTSPPTNALPGSAEYTAIAQSSSYTSGTVTLTIDAATTNNACSLTNNSPGTGSAYAFVQFDHAGTCVVDANQQGSVGTLAAAPQQQQTIVVGQLAQQLSVTSSAPSNATVGGSYAVAALPGSSGDPVVVSLDAASTAGSCSVIGTMVSFQHVGSCIVDVNEPESATSDWAPAPTVQQTIQVGTASQTINITSPSSAYVGQSLTPSADGGASGNPVTFSLGIGTTGGSCSYSGGTLTFESAGTCELDANQQASSDYQAAPQAMLDIAVTQLKLVFTSAAFNATTSASATTPFSIAAETVGGQPYVSSAPLGIGLLSSSSGGVFAATDGGAQVTSLIIPAGQSSATGYYGDTVTGSPVLRAVGSTGVSFLPAVQGEVEGALLSTLSYLEAPVDQLTNAGQTPIVQVQASDAFGNPVPGIQVQLLPSSGTLNGAMATTGATGVASFSGLSIPSAGQYVLQPQAGSVTGAASPAFDVFAPIHVSSLSVSSGTSSGGTLVTVKGSGLKGAQSVWFGSARASTFSILSDSLMTVRSPASASGTVDVTIANDVETSATSAADQFTFDPFVPSATALSVTPASAKPGQAVKMVATVVGSPPASTVTGHVSFYDGSTLVGSAGVGSTGLASFLDTGLPSGSGSITAVYGGNTVYSASTSAVVPVVVLAASTVQLQSSSSPWASLGQQITFTAEVAGSPAVFGVPTGTVTFMSGKTPLAVVPVGPSGTAVLPTSQLSTGTTAVTAVYSGDSGYAGATSAGVTENVLGPTTMTVTGKPTSNFGTPYRVLIKVSGSPQTGGVPAGTIAIYDYRTYLTTIPLSAAGTATYVSSSLPLGANSIEAYYHGGGDYYGVGNYVDMTVVQPVRVAVHVSASPESFPNAVQLSATVTPTVSVTATPTGGVQFMDGTTPIGGPVTIGTALTESFSPGVHALTAVYLGDGNFPGSTSPVFNENVVVPTTVQALPSGPVVEGNAAQVGAHLTAPGGLVPVGSLTLYEAGVALQTIPAPSSGDAYFSAVPQHVGSNVMTVKFTGSAPYQSSASTAISQFVIASPTIAVSSSASPAAPGKPVTLTATLSHSPAVSSSYAGTVTFYDGATTLGTAPVNGAGIGRLVTSSLALGSHVIVANYSGNASFTAASAAPFYEEILGPSKVTLSSSLNPDTTGSAVTLTANVTGVSAGAGVPTGIVAFMEGGLTLGIGGLDGSGSASALVASGTFTGGTGAVTAVYSGDSSFAGSTSAPVNETVVTPTAVYLSSSDGNAAPGENVTFTALVKDNAGSSQAPAGLVTFMDGSTSLGSASLDGTGTAIFATSSLAGGSHVITAVYAGDTAYEGSTSSPYYQSVSAAATQASSVTLTSNDNPAGLNDIVTFTAQVAPASPSAGAPVAVPTGTVTFFAGPVFLAVVPLDGTGSASWQIAALNYGAGDLSVTASYSGDGTYLPSSSGALEQVIGGSTGGLVSTNVQVGGNPFAAPPGTPVTFTVNVLPVVLGPTEPTGTVSLFDGPTELGTVTLDGFARASFTTSSLPIGSAFISAVYSGDSTFGTSTGYCPAIVGYSTVTSLTSSVTTANAGDPVTFNASVVGSPTDVGVPGGTVEFLEGSPKAPATSLGSVALDGNGDASLTISNLPTGTDSVYLAYMAAGGSPYTNSSSTTVQVTINPVTTSAAASDALREIGAAPAALVTRLGQLGWRRAV